MGDISARDTMEAYIYRRFGPPASVLYRVRIPQPRPERGQVLVRLGASGLNPHDTKRRSGWLGGQVPAEGIIPHSDGAGQVVEVGPGVSRALLDARVMVFGASHGAYAGTAAEQVVLPAENVIAIPDALSFTDAAALGVPAITACHAVLSGRPVANQWVLVQGGAGAVGRAAVAVARWAGARVIATVGSTEKAAVSRRAGAQVTLNYREDEIAAAVAELTAGQGVALVVDVDFGANLAIDAACLAENGRVASYSSTSERRPVLPYYDFAAKGATLHFVQGMNIPPQAAGHARDVIAAMLAEDRLIPGVAHVLDLASIAEGHDLLESGKARGKVVFTI